MFTNPCATPFELRIIFALRMCGGLFKTANTNWMSHLGLRMTRGHAGIDPSVCLGCT
jgi:hypothetical protein